MKTFFYFFWSSPPNLRAISLQKKDNIRIWSKIFTRSLPHSEFVWSRLRKRPPTQVFEPPQTHYSGSVLGAILFYSQCMINTVICDQRANKSSSFVLLNASILRKYRRKPSLRSASVLQFIKLKLLHFC